MKIDFNSYGVGKTTLLRFILNCCTVGGLCLQPMPSKHLSGRGCPKCARNKKIIQLDKTGKIIRIFDSISKAATSVGISNGNISLVAQGKQKTAGGFKWEYADKSLDSSQVRRYKKCQSKR
jgi:hypothetical protein